MKILGDATALATGTTKFTSATAVWVSNTATSASVTLRNAADDADLGSISVPTIKWSSYSLNCWSRSKRDSDYFRNTSWWLKLDFEYLID